MYNRQKPRASRSNGKRCKGRTTPQSPTGTSNQQQRVSAPGRGDANKRVAAAELKIAPLGENHGPRSTYGDTRAMGRHILRFTGAVGRVAAGVAPLCLNDLQCSANIQNNASTKAMGEQAQKFPELGQQRRIKGSTRPEHPVGQSPVGHPVGQSPESLHSRVEDVISRDKKEPRRRQQRLNKTVNRPEGSWPKQPP